jgi:TetR/AcrR family transcriptional repressor of nem operon
MGRLREFDISIAETKAMHLFWKKGYEGTSLKELTDNLGIGKGSLYTVYSGKRDLFLKSFKRYLKTIGLEAFKPLNEKGNSLKRLRSVFETVLFQITKDPLKRGCLMVNTITEMSGKDDVIKKAAMFAQEEVRSMFYIALLDYYKNDVKRAEKNSWVLLNLFLGLRVLAKSGPEKKNVEPIINAAFDAIR